MSYYVLVFVIVFLSDFSSASKCMKQSPCSCNIDEYSFISLSQLHPSKGDFFQDSESKISYFFSGCEDKEFKPKEYNVVSNETIPSVSLVRCNSTVWSGNSTVNNVTFPASFINQTCSSLGISKNIRFDVVTDVTSNQPGYQIVFTKSSNGSLPSILLACDTYNNTNLKILSSDTNALVLYSPLVCVQHISHHELSTGSIFCIIFFLLPLLPTLSVAD